MFVAKQFLPVLTMLAAYGVAPQTHAQSSMPLYTTTYCVEVEWSFWRSGGTYWANEYETSDLTEAQLVFALFESALESGALCEILGCSVTTWIPVDVRLRTKYEWNIYPVATPHVSPTKQYYLKQ